MEWGIGMKVLHIIGEFGYGGAEMIAAQICADLVAGGDAAELLVVGFCEKDVLEALRGKGVTVHRLESKLMSPLVAFWIWRIVRRGRFDVVHAHLFPCLYWGALAARWSKPSTKWVYTEHSTSNRRREYSWLRRIERWAYSSFGVVVCVSPQVRDALSKWLPGLPSLVILNGIDVARFNHAKPLDGGDVGVHPGTPLILTVGGFREEKNHAGLLQAVALLPDEFVLLLAGDGPLRGELFELARSLEILPRVRFLGVVRDVERLMKLAHVYVLPSHHEGFGLSAVEATAAGMKVVYANVPGLAELMAGIGWECQPDDPASIAKAILAAHEYVPNQLWVSKARSIALKHDRTGMLKSYRSLYLQTAVPAS